MNKLIHICLLLVFIQGCSSSSNVSKDNYADVYINKDAVLKPGYKVYHHKKDSSEIYFRVNPKELLFTRNENDSLFTANVGLHYKLYSDYKSKVILDSASFRYSDQTAERNSYVLSGKFNIMTDTGKTYVLEIIMTDLSRGQIATDIIRIDKSNSLNHQNFLVFNEDSSMAFRKYFSGGEKVILKSNEQLKVLHGLFYPPNYPLPPPPFSVQTPPSFEFDRGSSFEIDAAGNGFFSFVPDQKGHYHMRKTDHAKPGITVFNFGKHYPEIKTVDQMVKPLRYITTKNEYRTIAESKDRKKAIDEFWIKIAGSHDRGRKLIREYYTRVENANRFFTSYVEGWKTDRGLIYIVFGPPNVVSKAEKGETWVYGEENNMLSISFDFYKIQNPFTNNDYELNRSSVFKNSWYRAVDSWRQGRIF